MKMVLKQYVHLPLAYVLSCAVRAGHRWLSLARVNSPKPKTAEAGFAAPKTKVCMHLLD